MTRTATPRTMMTKTNDVDDELKVTGKRRTIMHDDNKTRECDDDDDDDNKDR